jgi:hypothetical protein
MKDPYVQGQDADVAGTGSAPQKSHKSGLRRLPPQETHGQSGTSWHTPAPIAKMEKKSLPAITRVGGLVGSTSAGQVPLLQNLS